MQSFTDPFPDALDSPNVSLDALSGSWRIYQLRDGHRFSTDDVLTAHYAIEHFPGVPTRILDLGCGIGSIALMLAWTWRSATVVGVEAQAGSAKLAKRSIAYNKEEDRVKVIHSDFRERHHIPAGPYDLITCSPPYLPVGSGTISEHSQKAYCRFELRGGVEDYLATARALLAPQGGISLVFGARWNDRVVEAARNAGLAIRQWQEVFPHTEREPLMTLFWLRPETGDWTVPTPEKPLITRDIDGRRTRAMLDLRLRLGMPLMPWDAASEGSP
tara:strand:+ start:2057 stop:2875 length:819 start_codon:yes stop_codon:yes gene_type:complete